MRKKAGELLGLISEFLKIQPTAKVNEVYHYFRKLGFPKTSIYRNFRAYKTNVIKFERPKTYKTSLKIIKKRYMLRRLLKNNPRHSISELSNKLEIPRSTCYSWVKRYHFINFAQKKIPKCSMNQKKKQITRSRRLYYQYSCSRKSLKFIMDDEAYFEVDGTVSSYWALPNTKIPENIKWVEKSKFPEKVLVWMAISEKGISKPYIKSTRGAMDMELYCKKCIRPRLQNFIKKHHSDGNYIFWADLATSHTGGTTTRFLRKLKIPYIPVFENPPNVPQMRPIETFWALLKRKVYSKGWKAKNINCLQRRIKSKINEFTEEDSFQLMKNVHSKIRKAAYFGVKSLL